MENRQSRHQDRSTSTPSKGPMRILVADDNPVNQQLAEAMLTAAGYQVRSVADGQQAVACYIADPHGFDLILMDLHMPEMGGMAAARAIRRREADLGNGDGQFPGKIPILAVTGETDPRERGRCLAAGMDDLVCKPFYWTALLRLIEGLVADRE